MEAEAWLKAPAAATAATAAAATASRPHSAILVGVSTELDAVALDLNRPQEVRRVAAAPSVAGLPVPPEGLVVFFQRDSGTIQPIHGPFIRSNVTAALRRWLTANTVAAAAPSLATAAVAGLPALSGQSHPHAAASYLLFQLAFFFKKKQTL